MSIAGFQLLQKSISTSNILQRLMAQASTQYYKNDALIITDGQFAQVAATSAATHIYVCMETPSPLLRPATADLSTTNGETILAVPCAGDILLFKTPLTGNSTPTKNGISLNSNTSLGTAVFNDSGGSSGDLLGGQAYFPSINYQAPILTDTVSASVRTITFPQVMQYAGDPFGQYAQPRAVTTGDTIIAVPWSKGATAVKFNSTQPSQGLDTTVSGKSGGKINIQGVVLSGTPYAVVSFPVASTS